MMKGDHLFFLRKYRMEKGKFISELYIYDVIFFWYSFSHEKLSIYRIEGGENHLRGSQGCRFKISIRWYQQLICGKWVPTQVSQYDPWRTPPPHRPSPPSQCQVSLQHCCIQLPKSDHRRQYRPSLSLIQENWIPKNWIPQGRFNRWNVGSTWLNIFPSTPWGNSAYLFLSHSPLIHERGAYTWDVQIWANEKLNPNRLAASKILFSGLLQHKIAKPSEKDGRVSKGAAFLSLNETFARGRINLRNPSW